MKIKKIISRHFIITHKELKDKLKVIGDIQSIGLYSGNREHDTDKDKWEIVTREVEEDASRSVEE